MAKKDTIATLKALVIQADESKTDKVLKEELTAAQKKAAPVLSDAEREQAALDASVDAATAAPDGVSTARPEASLNPLPADAVLVDVETGVRSIKPTGKFEAIANEIFNRQGVHVGTEDSHQTAARKTDRFNAQTHNAK